MHERFVDLKLMKKLSIIIPMYNSFHHVENTLKKLNNIKQINLEVILVDDCSTDESYLKAKKYVNKVNYELRVFKNEKNAGPGVARNLGIDMSTGDYITFVDSDDYLIVNFDYELVDLLDKEIDCVIFDYIIVDSECNKIKNGYSADITFDQGYINNKDALVYVFGSTWGKVYKREILVNNNIKYAELYRNEDMPFTKKAIAMSESIFYLRKSLYVYVQLETSLMHTSSLNDENNCQKAFKILTDSLEKNCYKEELMAIKLREVLNNSVLLMIGNRRRRNDIKKFIDNNYSKEYFKNKYFSKFPISVKITSYIIYMRLFLLLKILWRYKIWKKN